jgi:hypothetical protein
MDASKFLKLTYSLEELPGQEVPLFMNLNHLNYYRFLPESIELFFEEYSVAINYRYGDDNLTLTTSSLPPSQRLNFPAPGDQAMRGVFKRTASDSYTDTIIEMPKIFALNTEKIDRQKKENEEKANEACELAQRNSENIIKGYKEELESRLAACEKSNPPCTEEQIDAIKDLYTGLIEAEEEKAKRLCEKAQREIAGQDVTIDLQLVVPTGVQVDKLAP